MRIVYVPRRDAAQVVGGDIIYLKQIKKHIAQLGIEIEIVAADDLKHHAGGDLLHLTQIYQLDVAETAAEWAEAKRMPIVINPLFEEVLPMWFRWAVQRQPKWRALRRVCGTGLAEHIYTWWQTARRLHDPLWRRQRALLQRGHVVPNTRYELRHLQRWFDLPDLAGPLVPLGIDVELYGAWEPTANQYLPPILQEHRGSYVLEVGLISMRKNQVGLLQALAGTQMPLVLLGRPTPHEPEYYAEVKRLAEKRGHVILLEYVDAKALPALYGNAQVHVLPSWSERPGLVSLEAAACGCRVVASKRASIHEYLEHRAWYVDPAHPDQIRDTVEKAIASETPSGLREHALSYSWRNSAKALAGVYSAILSKSVAAE